MIILFILGAIFCCPDPSDLDCSNLGEDAVLQTDEFGCLYCAEMGSDCSDLYNECPQILYECGEANLVVDPFSGCPICRCQGVDCEPCRLWDSSDTPDDPCPNDHVVDSVTGCETCACDDASVVVTCDFDNPYDYCSDYCPVYQIDMETNIGCYTCDCATADECADLTDFENDCMKHCRYGFVNVNGCPICECQCPRADPNHCGFLCDFTYLTTTIEVGQEFLSDDFSDSTPIMMECTTCECESCGLDCAWGYSMIPNSDGSTGYEMVCECNEVPPFDVTDCPALEVDGVIEACHDLILSTTGDENCVRYGLKVDHVVPGDTSSPLCPVVPCECNTPEDMCPDSTTFEEECPLDCEFGFVKDFHDCEKCMCNQVDLDSTDCTVDIDACDRICLHGNKLDENFCPTCDCNPCSSDKYCTLGLVDTVNDDGTSSDNTGSYCECAQVIPPGSDICDIEGCDEDNCPFGYVVDETTNCPRCECLPDPGGNAGEYECIDDDGINTYSDLEEVCTLHCLYGLVWVKDGECHRCACRPEPFIPFDEDWENQLDGYPPCEMECPWGYMLDEDGLYYICECREEPNSLRTDCEKNDCGEMDCLYSIELDSVGCPTVDETTGMCNCAYGNDVDVMEDSMQDYIIVGDSGDEDDDVNDDSAIVTNLGFFLI